jgi:predicted nucleotidyltransferase
MSAHALPVPARKLRGTVLAIARARGVHNIRVFGSFARGDQRKDSDIDLLVELPKGSSLLDLAGLKMDLQEALRMKVDVLTEDGISRYLRERILHEARPL